jgi:hypothetical protein
LLDDFLDVIFVKSCMKNLDRSKPNSVVSTSAPNAKTDTVYWDISIDVLISLENDCWACSANVRRFAGSLVALNTWATGDLSSFRYGSFLR